MVENNHFRGTTGPALSLHTDAFFWNETIGCENVVVRGNTFEDCPGWLYSYSRFPACVNVSAGVDTGLSSYGVHKSVRIEDNLIKGTTGLATLVSSARGVEIRNNRIVRTNTESFDENHTGEAIDARPQGSIMITRSSDVVVEGNTQVLASTIQD